jgi:hypothetical protein
MRTTLLEPTKKHVEACECFLPTPFEKDKQKCSQRVLRLVAYEIYIFLILKPSKQ